MRILLIKDKFVLEEFEGTLAEAQARASTLLLQWGKGATVRISRLLGETTGSWNEKATDWTKQEP